MKSLILIFSTLFLFNNISYSQSDSLGYKRGKLILNGEKLKRFGAIKEVLLTNDNPEIKHHFNKFKTNRIVSTVFGFLGGVFIGKVIANELFTNISFDGIYFLEGLGFTGVGMYFEHVGNKNLKNAVNVFNKKNNNAQSSLNPIIYQNAQSGTNVGFLYSF
ncbi:MAG: hypothetical protein KA313_08715 [Pseudarcicella sp.]|nr:hypothetical protein [Pseudarcicella sp.]MBP6411165.1 hypothetical protein [Pseudarcicella sp.]